MTVTRPALRYHGAKWLLAPWIISHFPKHIAYVEPFGGGAAVLLQKKPAKLEVYNDLDGRVVNFFRVLREQTDELVRLLTLTPYSYEELKISKNPADDPLEDARRFFTMCWQGINANTGDGWRNVTAKGGLPGRLPSRQPGDAVQRLYGVAERLHGVQIDNRPASYVIDAHDHPRTLVYADPPYLRDTRTKSSVYSEEMTDKDHAQLLDQLSAIQSLVILSGYDNDLYNDMLPGWHRIDKTARTNGNADNSVTHKVESLWLSPRTYDALYGTKAKGVQKPLW